MPDLIPVSYWHCKEFEEFEVNVPSSKTGVYIVSFGPVPFGPVQRDWQCECKGFQFRKTCKHIPIAKRMRCGWSQYVDGGDVERDEKDSPRCPDCGGEVGAMDWAV